MTKKPIAPQAETQRVTLMEIMADPDFRQGFDDVRNGRPARFDEFAGDWQYERGRMLAYLVPTTMPLRNKKGRLNFDAFRILAKAFKSGAIR